MPFEGPRPEEVSALDAALAALGETLAERNNQSVEFPAGDHWTGRYHSETELIELTHNGVYSKIQLRENAKPEIEIFDLNGNALTEDIHSKQIHLDQLHTLLEAGLLPFQDTQSAQEAA